MICKSGKGPLLKLALVTLNIVVQIVAAALLNLFADKGGWAFAGGVFLVVTLNGIRFVSWGILNRHFPLSEVYPLTVLYIPALYLFSLVIREAQLDFLKILGVILILAGAVLINKVER